MKKKVSTFVILSFMLLALVMSCNSSPKAQIAQTTQTAVTQNEQKVKSTLNTEIFLGEWSDTAFYEEEGEFLKINFLLEDEKLIAKYNNGGPFEIYFTTKIEGQAIQLFFDKVLGTASFAKAFEGKDFDKEKPMAVCSIVDDHKLQLVVKNTKRPFFPEQGTYLLTPESN